MGIEAVKSSTPAPCRQMIKDGLKLMMNGTEDDVIKFIDDARKKLPDAIISKWLRRSLLTLLMALSVTSILGTTSLPMQKQSHCQVKSQ